MAIVADRSGNSPVDRSFLFGGLIPDLPWCTFNRLTGAPPNAALVSLYGGERVLDTSTGIVWQALRAAVNNSWQIATIAKGTGA